jgi:hypothetical protein
MRKFPKFMFGMMLAGAIASLLFLIIPTLFRSWHFVAKVSGTPSQIMSSEYPHIYVKTSDNLLFFCDAVDKVCSPIGNQIPLLASDPNTGCDKQALSTSLPPGKVVTSLAVECGIDGYHVIALEDGGIWTQGDSLFSALTAFMCGTFGAFAGMYIGFIYLTLSLLFGARPRAKAKNDGKHTSRL